MVRRMSDPAPSPNREATPCGDAATDEPGEAAGGRNAAERLGVDVAMLELLVCPLGGGHLALDAAAGVLVSRRARLAYPIRDGVPILAPGEASPLSEHDPRLHRRSG